MKRLLDTNVCVRFLRDNHPGVVAHLRRHSPADLVLCSVVRAELEYGARRSARVDEQLRVVRAFCSPFESLPFDDRAAEHYGLLRATLAAAGTPIGANDLMIASIGLAHDLTLVTANTREFARVTGLRVEDWEAE